MGSGGLSHKALFDQLGRIYERHLPFNRLLGMVVEDVTPEGATVGVAMRKELVGNLYQGILHGGVISAVLDTVGGLTVSAGLVERAAGLMEEEVTAMFARVGTIDLRVDYLRPGRGERFTAQGRIMRAGRKVAVSRMEMHNEKEVLIAVGTGTYMVG